MGQILLKKALPHLIAIATFLILNIFYFYPQLEGKVVRQGDIISNKGMGQEMKVYSQKTGENMLWTNSMFGGMPGYQIGVSHTGNKIGFIERIGRLFFKAPIGVFNTLMIGTYLLFILLGINPWLSIVGAIAFGLSSNHFILWEAGHTNKIRTIALFAPVVVGILLTFRHKYLTGGLFFAVGMALNLYANHVQMTYYLGMVLGIYVLIQVINHLREQRIAELLKVGGILLVGLLLAIGSSVSNLWTTYEYSEDTMRGAPILEKEASKTPSSSSEVEGLDWNYAMQWSNGFLDVAAALIPGVVGGGSNERIGPSSAVAKNMRSRGAQIDAAPLYWGALPFTSGPIYFGAGMCFLFILGLLVVKGPFKWWIGIAVLLTALISMGKNFEFFNRLLFDLLPMYSKFRAPSSITSVTALLVPLLGVVALNQVLQNKIPNKALTKALMIAGGITGGICLFFALIGPALFDFSNPGDATYGTRGWDIPSIIADRKSLMRTDAFRSLAFIALSAGLIWAYANGKIRQMLLLGGIGLLTLFDLWSVGKRYLNADNFVTAVQNKSVHTPRPVDQQIFAAENITFDAKTNSTSSDKIGRGGYRVLDLSINTFNSSSTSYFHNTIGGYHPAKLQRYQDIIDRYITSGDQRVLGMLNTKYIINAQGALQQNPNAMGNAWFVESIRKVNTPNEEIAALKNTDPATVAIVLDSEFNDYIGAFDPQKNGTIALQSYQPNHLVYTSNASSEQLAVFSEIWYGPDKGWQAYIDDQPVDHVRANYLLRALKIPAGQHQVEFKFEPRSYTLGSTVSLMSSLLLILGLLGLLVYKGKDLTRALEEEREMVKAPPAAPTKRKVAKTKKRRKKK